MAHYRCGCGTSEAFGADVPHAACSKCGGLVSNVVEAAPYTGVADSSAPAPAADPNAPKA